MAGRQKRAPRALARSARGKSRGRKHSQGQPVLHVTTWIPSEREGERERERERDRERERERQREREREREEG